jgi:hypothetical protein
MSSGFLGVAMVAVVASAEQQRPLVGDSSALKFTTVFQRNKTINSCYRIPLITYTASGTLLAIAEERYGAGFNNTAGCLDNYHAGHRGGHNQVSRRSTDMGLTWGPLHRQVGSLSNLRAVGGVDYTNPSVVHVRLRNGTSRILYHYSTQNNPSLEHHGHTIQLFSDDDGRTFHRTSVPVSAQLSAAGSAAHQYPGAIPGPVVGFVQNQPKMRAVLCAWGSTGTVPNGSFPSTCSPKCGDFLYSSTDFGEHWEASPPVDGVFANECMIAPLPNGSVVMLSRLANWQVSPHHYAATVWEPDLRTRAPLRNVSGLPTPICEGSLAAHPTSGALYFSNPSNDARRINLTIHKSLDAGGCAPG